MKPIIPKSIQDGRNKNRKIAAQPLLIIMIHPHQEEKDQKEKDYQQKNTEKIILYFAIAVVIHGFVFS